MAPYLTSVFGPPYTEQNYHIRQAKYGGPYMAPYTEMMMYHIRRRIRSYVKLPYTAPYTESVFEQKLPKKVLLEA